MTDNANKSDGVLGANERFEELGRGCYAYSADGCSNTGVIIGEKAVLVVDAQATPQMAQKVLQKIRDITDKPVKQVVLTHFHSGGCLGATAFEPGEIVASDLTRRMMDTRGREEIRVSRQRLPGLFVGLPENADVVSPTMTIASSMTIDLGGLDVRLMHLGRGHTMGDLVVWVPDQAVLFAGDMVQKSAVPCCGDAHLADWPRALDRISAFRPAALMPGRGRPAIGASAVTQAIETTRDFVTTLNDAASACVVQSLGLRDTFLAVRDALEPRFGTMTDFEFNLPLSLARAYDEALGLDQPQVWTRERLADLDDALGDLSSIAKPAGETAETAADDASGVGADLEMQEPGAEETADEDGKRELVADSDFAASLEQLEEDAGPDVSAEGSSGMQDEDAEAVQSGDTAGADTEKVLENAR
ncbi:MBL fold metallo-hydrolase [Labrenzia sp. OB1]|uniref:MBL fold metallo-hydrolase n=1 Tax=Labrenzia sp. OB1 TaxID=1561204 RepID=UPI0007B21846|nr:MBL fold metallo-hydrolase [Labrenzia sp. OB1]KZM47854.1 metallo-beta-lactamase [Labrenzia sp. OB1]